MKFKRRIPACLRTRGTAQRVQSADLFVFVCSCLLLVVVLVHLQTPELDLDSFSVFLGGLCSEV